MKRFSFPKTKRLVSNRQFKAVLQRNIRVSDGLLTLFMAENQYSYPRLGISVGKSTGKAVVRNHLKRLLREAFRQNQHKIPAGFDYLLMISPQLSKKLNKSRQPKETQRQLRVPISRKNAKWSPNFEQIQTSLLNLVARIADKDMK